MKKMSQHLNPQIKKLTEHENHGRVIWRYCELNKKYNSPNFLDRLSVISNLFVQPIGHLIFWITFIGFPNVYTYFGGELNLSWFKLFFYVFSSIQIIWSCVTGWADVIEYCQLSTTIMIWKLLTLRLRVPTITVKSTDANHQLFKWSAGALCLFNHV